MNVDPGGESVGACRLRSGLCLPHAPSPARPPPSTSPSSQWWAPSWRGSRRWGRRRALALKLAAALRHGICLVAGGVCTRGRRAPPASRPASCRRARTASGSAAGAGGAPRPRRRAARGAPLGRVGRGLLHGGGERRRDGRRRPAAASGPRVGARGGAGVQFSPAARGSSRASREAARFVRRWAPGSRSAPRCRVLAGMPDLPPARARRCRSPTRRSTRAARTASSPPRCVLGRATRRRRRGSGRDRADRWSPGRPRRARHLVRPRRPRDRGAPRRAARRRRGPAGDAVLEVTRPRAARRAAGARRGALARRVELPAGAGSLATSGAPARRPGRAPGGLAAASRSRSRSTSPTRPTAARSPAWPKSWRCAFRRATGPTACARSPSAWTPTAPWSAPAARRPRRARRRRRGGARPRRRRRLPPYAGAAGADARVVALAGAALREREDCVSA